MTEKDSVKYSGTAVSNAWYVPVDVRLPVAAESAVGELITAMDSAASPRMKAGSV